METCKPEKKCNSIAGHFNLYDTSFHVACSTRRDLFSADQISIQPDNVLRAKGNIFVKRGLFQ